VQEGESKLTQRKHVVGVTAPIARAETAKVGAKVVLAASEPVVAGADGVGEAARGREGEAAGVRVPAEAGVEVELGPVLVLVVNLAAALEHHRLAMVVVVEVGDRELGAAVEESAGGSGDVGQSSDGDGSSDGGNHFDILCKSLRQGLCVMWFRPMSMMNLDCGMLVWFPNLEMLVL
jgi:hypothetical protein